MTRNRYFDLDVETVGCRRIVEAGDVEGLAAGRRHLAASLDHERFGRDLIAALGRIAPI